MSITKVNNCIIYENLLLNEVMKKKKAFSIHKLNYKFRFLR